MSQKTSDIRELSKAYREFQRKFSDFLLHLYQGYRLSSEDNLVRDNLARGLMVMATDLQNLKGGKSWTSSQ